MENAKILSQEEKLDKLWDKGTLILLRSLGFVCGFILSGARLFSMYVPLGTGFAAACSGTGFAAAGLGAALGSFLRLSDEELICSLIPLAGLTGLKFFFEKTEYRPKTGFAMPLCIFSLCFFCGAVSLFAGEPSFGGLLTSLCSACLTAASVTFYSGVSDCLKSHRKPYFFDDHSLVCIAVSLCSLLLGSSELSFLGFRPAGLFAAFVTLAAAFFFGQSGGSVAGIVMGMGSAVAGTGAAAALSLGICGLLGGIFSRFGKYAGAAAFVISSAISALTDGTADGTAVFAQAAAAALIFVLIPKKHLTKIECRIREPEAIKLGTEYSAAGEKLKSAAAAVGSVSSCVASVSKGISSMAPAAEMLVCMRVRERVCSACRLKDTFCPENGEFAEIAEKLASGEEISAADFSLNFNSKCPSVPRLADNFNRIYAGRKAVNALQATAARNRELACGQFDWMAELLRELSSETEESASEMLEKEKTALRVLSKNSFNVLSVNCICRSPGAIKLSCSVSGIPAGLSLSRLTSELSRELRTELEPPEIKDNEESKDLIFRRRELFGVRVGAARASFGDQKLCGDYHEYFRFGNSVYIVLSDGMGTGGRAAVDSAMTVELFSRLIKAGISPGTALKITNSALTVKSDDESLSTLDLAVIDLFAGSVKLFKAGAAASFHTVSGRMKTAEFPSSPLGILSKVEFEEYEASMRGGDILIMVSDGVLGTGSGWISDEIRSADGISDPQTLSELILNTARHRCGEKFDDMTVITALVEEL